MSERSMPNIAVFCVKYICFLILVIYEYPVIAGYINHNEVIHREKHYSIVLRVASRE